MKHIADVLRQFSITVARAWKKCTASRIVQKFRRELRFLGVKRYLEMRRTGTPSRSSAEPDQCPRREGDDERK